MKITHYRHRVIEKIIKECLQYKGAILVEGPSTAGKTTTCEQFAKRILNMGNGNNREQNLLFFTYLLAVNTNLSSCRGHFNPQFQCPCDYLPASLFVKKLLECSFSKISMLSFFASNRRKILLFISLLYSFGNLIFSCFAPAFTFVET